MTEEERKTQFARARDLAALARKRGSAAGDFLTEEERAAYETFFRNHKAEAPDLTCSFVGGVRGAERTVPVVLRDDLSFLDPARFAGVEVLRFVCRDARTPDHRAVLGSLMGSGLTRDSVGDLFRYENDMAAVVKSTVAPYVISELSRIGSSPAKAERLSLPEEFEIPHAFEEMTVTVSSLRLDCLVAALCRLSREEAADRIRKGLVSVDHSEALGPDRRISPGALLSLRGSGRYRLGEEEGFTKSGRLRLKVFRFL